MDQSKAAYANGQIKEEIRACIKTVFFKTGRIKAQGPFLQGKMEGKWTFYRETGELWQTGELKADVKHGIWERFDRQGQLEYREEFNNGRQVKKKQEG